MCCPMSYTVITIFTKNCSKNDLLFPFHAKKSDEILCGFNQQYKLICCQSQAHLNHISICGCLSPHNSAIHKELQVGIRTKYQDFLGIWRSNIFQLISRPLDVNVWISPQVDNNWPTPRRLQRLDALSLECRQARELFSCSTAWLRSGITLYDSQMGTTQVNNGVGISVGRVRFWRGTTIQGYVVVVGGRW